MDGSERARSTITPLAPDCAIPLLSRRSAPTPTACLPVLTPGYPDNVRPGRPWTRGDCAGGPRPSARSTPAATTT